MKSSLVKKLETCRTAVIPDKIAEENVPKTIDVDTQQKLVTR
jgi:hypothetical protein